MPKPRQINPVSRRLTWIFVLGVALSLAAMIASNDQDAITNLLRHDIGSLVLKIVLVVSAGVRGRGRRRTPTTSQKKPPITERCQPKP